MESLYYLGEYAFGLLVIAGCRNCANGAVVTRRDVARLAPPAVALSLLLPWVHPEFSTRFIPQAAVLALAFAVAFRHLQRGRHPATEGPGLRLMSVALVALTLNFLHYVPVFGYHALTGFPLSAMYGAYTSVLDLVLETMLGFGMVVLVMEDARRAVESAVRELQAARDRLEGMARVDPLTESLNRHAFYTLVEKNRATPAPALEGCVTVVDIDKLKPINDSFGHAAGDAAIRAVSRAIRQMVRADDLVFRWGGDEFLVVLFGVSEEEARRRLGAVDTNLGHVQVPGAPQPLRITVSMGTAAFSQVTPLERAIEEADDAMYLRKQSRSSLSGTA